MKADVSPAAEIDGTYYETLQDAVDDVQDGQTIRLEKDVDSKVTVSREVTFSIDINGKKFDSDNITAGSGYSLSRDGNTFTVERGPRVSAYRCRLDLLHCSGKVRVNRGEKKELM